MPVRPLILLLLAALALGACARSGDPAEARPRGTYVGGSAGVGF